MKRWFEYSASDFDLRSHRADLEIDLQEIDLDSGSIDVLLTPHVLEHVPDTDQALIEIYRVLAPGGRMFLQVPILQGSTARPSTPEFHGDNTPVEWRFGPDLTSRLRQHGFDSRVLCTQGFYLHVADGGRHWPDPVSPEFDVESILGTMDANDLETVADDNISRRVGFQPSYMFLTWECIKPT
jgi:SAM-dependent methyltransferase